jgi:hypothetical protein
MLWIIVEDSVPFPHEPSPESQFCYLRCYQFHL